MNPHGITFGDEEVIDCRNDVMVKICVVHIGEVRIPELLARRLHEYDASARTVLHRSREDDRAHRCGVLIDAIMFFAEHLRRTIIILFFDIRVLQHAEVAGVDGADFPPLPLEGFAVDVHLRQYLAVICKFGNGVIAEPREKFFHAAHLA